MGIVYKYPIFNKDGEIFGFDIFLRNEDLSENGKKNSKIINLLLEEDPSRIFGDKKVLVELSQEFIEAAFFELLPSSHVIVKIKNVQKVTEKFIRDIQELKMRGFSICLSDFKFEKVNLLPLLTVSDFVIVNWKRFYSEEDFVEELATLKSLNKKIIFREINSKEDLDKAKDFGDLFQGKALAPPSLVKDIKSVLFLKNTIVKLFQALQEKSLDKVVRIIESDVGLTYKLLKWVKNFYPGKAEDIQTVGDAVLFLSINDIGNFVLALAMAELFAGKREEEIIKRSLFRAHLAEELSKLYVPDYTKQAYLIGLFSLMEELIGEEPASLARELKLSEEIVEAFERRYNEFGLLLSLIELLEFHHKDEDILKHVAKMINSSKEEVKEAIRRAQKKAIELTQWRMSVDPENKDLLQRNI